MKASSTAEVIDRAKATGRTALVGYLPAGYPDTARSIEAGIALAEGGADLIEIGIPYSDPVMDGSVIQQATQQALAGGFRVPEVFDVVSEITAATRGAVPVSVMTYWNPVLRIGVRDFSRRLAEAGGAGLITPDLIPDEAGEWLAASDDFGLDRIFLSAPSSTPERMSQTVQASRGFVYAVSVMGVTGARQEVSTSAESVVSRLRAAGAERVCVGLGVSQAEHVRQIARYADGAIVGTALVAALRDHGREGVIRLMAELRRGAGGAADS